MKLRDRLLGCAAAAWSVGFCVVAYAVFSAALGGEPGLGGIKVLACAMVVAVGFGAAAFFVDLLQQ